MEQLPTVVRVPSRNSRVHGTLASIGRWTLVAIVLGFALIGFLHVTRGTAVCHVLGVSSDRTPIAVAAPEFALMAAMATGAWLGPGNRVDVLLNGDGTYPQLWEDLRSAKESITPQLYYGAPGRMADNLGQALIERAKAGVRVLVLYDAFGTVDMPAGQATRSEPWASSSSRSVRYAFHAPSRTEPLARSRHCHRQSYRMDRRLRHRRQVVWRWTDERVLAGNQCALRGSSGQAAAGRVRGRVGRSHRRDVDRACHAVATRERRGRRGVVYTTPTLGSTAAERLFALSIAGAQHTLYITNSYFAPERSFIDLLAAAAKGGSMSVSLRLVHEPT